MVHKNVQDADFTPLRNGDPIYTLFDGQEIAGTVTTKPTRISSMKRRTTTTIWLCRWVRRSISTLSNSCLRNPQQKAPFSVVLFCAHAKIMQPNGH